MMEFNDQVTFVDYPGELERREIEVLIKLVPFVERDVEERCAELDEAAQEEVKLKRGMQEGNAGYLFIGDDEIYAECERMKGRENERLVRLREAILERAGRVFPELRVGSEGAEAREDFRPVSGGDAGGGSLTSRGGESATGFMTSQGGSCNRTEET